MSNRRARGRWLLIPLVQLLWATVLGYLTFGSLPDVWTALGASVIAASGLYTAYRERVRAMEQRRAEGRA